MIRYPIVAIHNISRPGHAAAMGDDIQVETTGGLVRRVDPKTRLASDAPQTFCVQYGRALKTVSVEPFTLPKDWRK
jgi:hypothetical protein